MGNGKGSKGAAHGSGSGTLKEVYPCPIPKFCQDPQDYMTWGKHGFRIREYADYENLEELVKAAAYQISRSKDIRLKLPSALKEYFVEKFQVLYIGEAAKMKRDKKTTLSSQEVRTESWIYTAWEYYSPIELQKLSDQEKAAYFRNYEFTMKMVDPFTGDGKNQRYKTKFSPLDQTPKPKIYVSGKEI